MKVPKIDKTYAFILGVIMLAIMLGWSIPVQAAQDGDYTYTTDDGKAHITKYTGSEGDVTIPGTLGGFNVTSIGNSAFSNCSQLTGVTIPEGITSIGNYAFFNCTVLTNITIAESVTDIGISAFYGCTSLTGITIPEGVTNINTWAFHKCTGLTSVTIPASVTYIGDSFGSCTSLTNINVVAENVYYSSQGGVLFDKGGTTLVQCPAGLTSITIPEAVTSIGEGAFIGCTGLSGITLPEGVTIIGDEAFCACPGLTSINIPGGVTSIGYETFWGCTGLTSITLPEGVTSIGDEAFSGCTGITSITIPEGVTSIGNQAFTKCTSLASITLPQSITSIGEGAFGLCGITSITIPQGVTNIGKGAFSGCINLTNITVAAENSDYSSKDGVLFNKLGTILVQCPGGLTNVVIPQEVTAIADLAFSYCSKISSIEIPQGITSIGESAFALCTGLTSINIPEGVTSIGKATFVMCTSLTSITIPEGVTSIGGMAFGGTGLTGITIPQTVISIGEQAFYGCMNLASITFKSETTAIFDNAATIPSATEIIGYEPSSAKDYAAKYNRAFQVLEIGDYTYTIANGKAEITGYTGSGGDVTIPSTLGGVNVTSIGDSAFKYCTGITGITIPEGVTSVGREAFCDCTDLTSITISKSVTSIGEDAFLECTNLTAISVDNNNLTYMSKDGVLFNKTGTTLMACPAGLTSITIPPEVNSIGPGAFQYCKGLTGITIPQAVTSIGDWAFHHCEGLMSITIPPAVTNIGSYAFNNCLALTSITIPQGVTSIGPGAFSNCKKLTVITVDDGNSTYVSKDGVLFNQAGTIFMACPAGLTSITIPQEVTSIDECAFSGCLGLTSITIPEKVTSIGKGAFSNCFGLTSINIPPGVTGISDSAFFGCIGLTGITIPEGVTSIGDSAFFGCRSLTNITIPQGVTGIGSRAFLYCTGLTSITIPEVVISIGENAFSGCTGLTSIRFNSAKTTIFDNADTIPATTKIIGYDPSGAKDYAAKYGRTFQIRSHSRDEESNSAAASGVNILINGESLNEGKITITKEGTRTIATVTLDQKELEQKLTQAGNNTVVIPVNNDADAVIGELNGQMIKNMEYKQVTAVLKTQNASYNLSPQQINIDAVAAQLGAEPQDIKVQIQITKPNTEMLKVVENSAKNGEFIIVAPAVEFSVKCTCGDKTVELSRFDSYVQRTVAIPEGVNPSQITTAVVVEQDGTVRHVPTQLTQIDNQYYAQINSLTNSAYSVISHPIEFKDVDKHWAKKEINDMGSRMVVSGVSKENYEPDRDITRAEFAAILVQALGLKPGNGQAAFSDVQGSDWFSGAIQTASQYQIISGYGSGKFGPTDKITREQAITMIAKAMNITGLKAEFREGDAEKILAGFTDAGKTAEYARSSMTACVKTGLITGKIGNMLAPQDNITRAEVAWVVQKLLQKSKLI